MKRLKRYESLFEAETAALEASYKHGQVFYIYQHTPHPHGRMGSDASLYSIRSEEQETKDKRHAYSFGNNPGVRRITSTYEFGFRRGLLKELGDDNPCKVLFKSEVDKRRYTW